MRSAPVLLSAALLLLASCGSEEPGPRSAPTPAVALKGADWIGTPVDPTAGGGKVTAIAFFQPG